MKEQTPAYIADLGQCFLNKARVPSLPCGVSVVGEPLNIVLLAVHRADGATSLKRSPIDAICQVFLKISSTVHPSSLSIIAFI